MSLSEPTDCSATLADESERHILTTRMEMRTTTHDCRWKLYISTHAARTYFPQLVFIYLATLDTITATAFVRVPLICMASVLEVGVFAFARRFCFCFFKAARLTC
jgi:hypothetical protein